MRLARHVLSPALALWFVALAACGNSADGTACDNGADDDGDGLVDLDDPGCAAAEDDSEANLPPPDCDDNFDNDGDGLLDYPNDPGCLSPLQDDETDDCPDGNDCPECGNGLDDDGDGATDYPDDTSCQDAAGAREHTFNADACGGAPTVVELTTATVNATLPLVASRLTSTCGGAGGELVYEVLVTERQVLVASTNVGAGGVDTVLSLRSSCLDAASEVACNDDDGDVTSTLIANVEPGVYYLIVDGKLASSNGAFTLSVERFAGEGAACDGAGDCGPGLVCKAASVGGDLVCTIPECGDGDDDDGDADVDYPADPGCASAFDDDESDTCPGVGCPACSNGLDDDGDELIDYLVDDDCLYAGQPVEGCGVESDPVLVAVGPITTGSTAGATDDFTASCTSDGAAGDVVVFADLPATATLTVTTTGSNFDTILSMFDATCGGTSLGCDDEGGGNGTSRIAKTNFAAGIYALVVDGWLGDEGSVRVNITGTIAAGGRCDGVLAASGALTCGEGYACGAAGTCIGQFECNDGDDDDADGLIDYPAEPGCETPLDDDELDTCPGAGCPACSNDLDDDGDGDIDYLGDDTCIAASGLSELCPSSEAVLPLTAAVTTGDTTGHVHDTRPTCSSTINSAPDDLYQLDLPATTTLTIAQTSAAFWDSVIELRDASCAGTPVQCADGGTITRTNQPGGRYFLLVDGYDTDIGAYTVTVSGRIANGASCESPLAQSGALLCADGFACAGAPGARVCTPAACNDAVDADGDGLPGYPSDPGCLSPNDNDEVDACPGGACPACSNDADDDGDLFIDYGIDLSCAAASTQFEGCGAEADPMLPLGLKRTTSTTASLASNFTPVAGCSGSTSAGPDRVLSLVLPVPVATLQLNTNGSTLDSVLGLYSGACATSVACDDDGGDGTQSLINATNLAAGTYAVIVDSYGTTGNTFVLNASGTVAAGTACTHELFTVGVLACGAGLTCTAGTCQ